MSTSGPSVKGMRELMVKLKQVQGEARVTMQVEVKSTLHDMVDHARDLVPYVSGELHDSLTYELDPDRLSGAAGSNTPYANAIEFGYKGRPATPYMYPALKKARRRLKTRLTKAMNAALRSVTE